MIDPRILPCGKSLCNRCVYSLSDFKFRRVNCQNCGKSHEIPHDGFPINISLQTLLKCELKEFSTLDFATKDNPPPKPASSNYQPFGPITSSSKNVFQPFGFGGSLQRTAAPMPLFGAAAASSQAVNNNNNNNNKNDDENKQAQLLKRESDKSGIKT